MNQDRTEPLSMPTAPEEARATGSPAAQTQGIEGRILRWLLRAAGNPEVALVLWDGRTVTASASPPVARIVIRDRVAMLKLVLRPDLQFGELYSSGRVVVEGDFLACQEALQRSLPDFEKQKLWVRWLSALYLWRRNTLPRARDNIYHHYDIGNDFYRLWLDERMVYTCAYFPTADASLEEAQVAKMDHVCRKLRLKPGEDVVEAGCGWGALALHMAKYYGVKVKAYNISKEQLAFARDLAAREGLADRVEYIEGDYREIRGQYDVFVSVGMLEHVGLNHYHELGQVMDRCLKPRVGRGLIHSIGRNRPAPMNAWIQKRIFPGAYPPSLGEMMRLFEPWRFSILDVENLRLHYARTLLHWLARFEAAADRVAEMFDPTFVRMWRFYLAGSEAAFAVGELQLFQVVFARFDNNDVPLTRHFLYADR